MKRTSERGFIESGTPFAIMTLMAIILLSGYWGSLPLWARIAGVVVVVILAGFCIGGLNQPSGMGGMAARQREIDRKKNADTSNPGEK